MQAKQDTQSMLLGAFKERIPDNVLLEPLEYIFADHCRQADLCEALKSFATNYSGAAPNQDMAAVILRCLDVDLSLHIADEELDLFPRLSNRALAEDNFAELLRMLDQEHERDGVLVDEVRAGFACIADGGTLDNPDQFRRAVMTLAATHLSHLNWENSVVLPLARKRLTAEDLDAMGRTMAARRSIAYPRN